MLNWILIAMMAMLPLRGVLAFDLSACATHEQASQAMEAHHIHMTDRQNDTAQTDTAESECCCCDSTMKCSNDCGIGASLSFIAQQAITVPALTGSAFNFNPDSNLVFRDLAPPVRPPAYLQI